MVYINAKGDVVKDNVPLAESTPLEAPSLAGTSATRRNPRRQRHDENTQTQSSGNGNNSANGVDGIFTPVSRYLGIEGQTITLPAIPAVGFEAPFKVPTVHMLSGMVLTLFFGWKAGIVAAFVYGAKLQNSIKNERSTAQTQDEGSDRRLDAD